MKKEKYCNILKTLLFIVIILTFGYCLFGIFVYKDMGGGGWQRFYQAEKNSIDVMIYGSSHAHCTVDNTTLWDQYGIASYTLSAGSQDIDNTYYFMKETLKTQKPKVMMVELYMATNNQMMNDEATVYRNTLGMNWSRLFVQYVEHLADTTGMTEMLQRQLLFKIPIIHSRYQELTKEDFQDDIYFLRGYRGSFEWTPYDAAPEACVITEAEAIAEEKKEYLIKMIDLCRENDIQLFFFVAPYMLSDKEQMRFHDMSRFADENGIPFINFNLEYKKVGFDYTTDMREESHVNDKGAVKITKYLGEQLKEIGDIPDRRDNEEYKLWEINSNYMESKRIRNQLEQQQDIFSYMDVLKGIPEEYLILFSLEGNYNALGEAYTDSLVSFGIDIDSYHMGGVWIKQNGKFIYYSKDKQTFVENLRIDKCEIRVSREEKKLDDNEEIITSELIINSKDYQNIVNGINIVVYDTKLNMLVDVTGVDVYQGLDMVRGNRDTP